MTFLKYNFDTQFAIPDPLRYFVCIIMIGELPKKIIIYMQQVQNINSINIAINIK